MSLSQPVFAQSQVLFRNTVFIQNPIYSKATFYSRLREKSENKLKSPFSSRINLIYTNYKFEEAISDTYKQKSA